MNPNHNTTRLIPAKAKTLLLAAGLAIFTAAISARANALTGYYTQVAVGDPDFGGGTNVGGQILSTGLIQSQLGPHGLPVLSAAGITRLGTPLDMNPTTHELLWWSPGFDPYVSLDENFVQTNSMPMNFGYPKTNWYPTGQTGDNNFYRTVQWQGTFTLANPGSIVLNLSVDDDAWVFIDGTLVSENHYGYASNTTNSMSAGPHTIIVFYDDRIPIYDQVHFTSSLALTPVAVPGPVPLPPGPSVMPPLPSPGTYQNSTNFNFSTKTFDFTYTASDGTTLTYEYKPTGGSDGTFHVLTCKVNGTNSFLPSNEGGLSLIAANGSEIPTYFSPGVTFNLLSVSQISPGVLQAKWRMKYTTNGVATTMDYTYTFQIMGRTLIIQATNLTGVSGGIDLDRSEFSTNSAPIGVPYLSLMDVLYCDGAFCSMYFDWESSPASTLVPKGPHNYSAYSVYYAQDAEYLPLVNGNSANVNETIYLTVSPTLADVLPTIPNPQSPKKNVVANYLVFDNYQQTNAQFANVNAAVQSLADQGISNLWVIVHDWQNQFFDNGYPDVLPANTCLGGDPGLLTVSQTASNNGYLFAVHENYRDFYQDATTDPNPNYQWNPANCALNFNGSLILSWTNRISTDPFSCQTIPPVTVYAYEMKPTQASNYASYFAPQIHADYGTTAAFLDVHSSVNPSDWVDYDPAVSGAASFRGPLTQYRALFSQLRSAHNGPVSGEGFNHMLYLGYIDDVEAEIETGAGDAGFPYTTGQWLPLLVDFDLSKLHSLTLPHGVGYYERFYKDPGGNKMYNVYSNTAALEYIATELAYGHGGYIPPPDRVDNYTNVAILESSYVYPAQQLYANTIATNILYHDPTVGDQLHVSDYIRRYWTNYGVSTNVNFMSQVQIAYSNGVVVCVNRNPIQSWTVTVGQPGGWFDVNAATVGGNFQWVGPTNVNTYTLPPTNGWLIYSPTGP